MLPSSANACLLWRPTPVLGVSALMHVTGALTLAAEPAMWPWAVGTVLGNHVLIGAAVLWPRGQFMGPNLVRLPVEAQGRGEVSLTFDDGPDPEFTPRVLDLLDRYRAKASFFCIGEKVRAYPRIVKEIALRGHSVENHSHHHPGAFALYGWSRLSREVEAAQAAIAEITGRRPAYFRAPAGFRNPFLEPVLAERGLRYVSWTRRGFDALCKQPGPVVRRLTRRLAAGDVLLLHDNRKVTLEVTPALLDRLQQERLRSVSLPAACGEGTAC